MTEAKRLLNPQTIGDHIRRRRLELKLRQEDVARMIGVSCRTLTYWEIGLAEPHIEQGPNIIKFLGYHLEPFGTKTLGDQIKNYRFLHGLSCKALSRILDVNLSSIYSWEANEFMPKPSLLKRLNELLEPTTNL
jgi:transcriptional regulator with XRE-family HTH domain